MKVNLTLLSQIINSLNRVSFNKTVQKYDSDKHSKGINSWTHLVSMLFCHLAKANSIREITYGLKSLEGNVNHLGILKKVPSRSSLSYINAHRNWEVFRDYYYELFDLFVNNNPKLKNKTFKTKRKIYLLDSTLITLCLKVYNWSHYIKTKGAIKLHTLLDYDGLLPVFVHLTDGRSSDVRTAKYIEVPSHSVLVADRGYIDFRLFKKWNAQDIKFVVRCRENNNLALYKENELPKDKSQNLLSDRIVYCGDWHSRKVYPEKLRLITLINPNNNKPIYLLTNQLSWTAQTISELYKQRWQIEIFFKELKTHLKIKSFIGTTHNAVMIQIWTALITMLIIKHLKQVSQYNWSLSNLIAFLRMNLFVKISLLEWLNHPFKHWEELEEELNNQLMLFDRRV